MVLDIDIIAYADLQIKRHHIANFHIEYYDISLPEVSRYFPNYMATIGPLIKMLQFTHSQYGQRVMLLDLLVLICILITATTNEKGHYLFEWFNHNKTGLLEEQEHVNLIQRVLHTFKAIKLMGSIDITLEEVRYLALEARSRYENAELRFVPGLYIGDFVKWMNRSTEVKGIFRFVEVLHKLVDSLVALDRRSQALKTVTSSQKQHMDARLPVVPDRLTLGVTVKSDSAVTTVFRSQNTCSFSLCDEHARHSGRYSVLITPSNLTIRSVESLLYGGGGGGGQSGHLDKSALVVFTGTVCDVQETLRFLHSLLLAPSHFVSLQDLDRLSVTLCSAAGGVLEREWFTSLNLLHSLVSTTAANSSENHSPPLHSA
eukprot:gene23244-29449_t